MRPIRLLVDSFADANESNSQMTNARDIIARLDPERFHVTMFCCGTPHPALAARPQTALIRLTERRQTPTILKEFVFGRQDILFYIKPSPSSKMYLRFRRKWLDRKVVIGSVESQCDAPQDETIKEEQVRLWKQTVLRSDILVSNSPSVQASLKNHYGLCSAIIPTGVDSRFFSPVADRPANGRPRVLFVGSLRLFKGPQLLVEAAARYPEADFVIVGDGPQASNLQRQVHELRLHNCELTGGLFGPGLREQYRRADIFLFPSRWEGSPKVILEAAACGLPVLARNDYDPQTVVHGETGYLARSDDELLNYLEILLRNFEVRQTMGEASRRLSLRFDWNLITRQWEEVFTREASRAGVRP